MTGAQKYHYKTSNDGQLLDVCGYKQDSRMLQYGSKMAEIKVGSVSCKECEHCTAYDDKNNWIVCKVADSSVVKGRSEMLLDL